VQSSRRSHPPLYVDRLYIDRCLTEPSPGIRTEPAVIVGFEPLLD
jgi:hypothetical protein